MTRDEMMSMAREVGLFVPHEGIPENGAFMRCAALIEERAAAAEREACAKVAAEPQGWAMPSFNHAPSDRTIGRIEGEKEMSYRIAAAIRARGMK
jgi:hypothetical protein